MRCQWLPQYSPCGPAGCGDFCYFPALICRRGVVYALTESTEGLLTGPDSCLQKVNSWPPAACFQVWACLFPTSLSGFAAPGLTVAPEPHPVCALLNPLILVFGPRVSSLCRDTPPPAIWIRLALGNPPLPLCPLGFRLLLFLSLISSGYDLTASQLSWSCCLSLSLWLTTSEMLKKKYSYSYLSFTEFFVPTMTLSDKEHDLLCNFFLSVEAQIGLLFH